MDRGAEEGGEAKGIGSHWSELFSLVRPHRVRATLLGLALGASGALPLFGPVLLAMFLDGALGDASATRLTSIALAYMAVGLVRQFVEVMVVWSATDLAWKVGNDLRSRLAAHVLRLDLAFHRSTSPGALVSRIDGDVTALSEFVSRFLVGSLAAVVTLVGMVVVVLVRDVWVGLILLAYVVLGALAVFRLRSKAVDESADEQESTGRVLGEVEERLAGADDLRSNGGGGHALARFRFLSIGLLNASIARERASVRIWVVASAVFALGGAASIALGGYFVQQGNITVGTAFLLFQYTQLLRQPLDRLADEIQGVQRAAGGMRRSTELLARKSAIDTSGDRRAPTGALEVVFDDVSFSYEDEEEPTPVLHRVTLPIPAGTSIGLLGRTGSGKTTLGRLVLRLLDPTEGAVRLGGVDLRDLDLDALRLRIGVVNQEVHLFGATMRDNLTLFDEEVDDPAIERALAALGLLDWVHELPEGLDTMLGAGGAGISAGEAQLVALTRLFLRDPDLVVLDEASSRIDPHTEERVTAALDGLLAGRTAIVIAHRLGTVERLDNVAVLDAGRVVEHGPTSELAADASSRYAELRRVGNEGLLL